MRMLMVLFSVLLAGALLGITPSGAQVPPISHPNIVVLMTDDMRYDQMRFLPETTKLFPGLRYTQAFYVQTLCCPSRTTFLTGMYPHNHRIQDNDRDPGADQIFRDGPYDDRALPVALDHAGYRTALIGKYLNGYGGDYVPPGWDRWFAHTGGDSGVWKPTYYGSTEGHVTSSTIDAETLAGKSEDFLSSSNPSPFFLLTTFHSPHPPVQMAPQYSDIYGGEGLPRTPEWNEEDVTDKPQWVQNLPPISADRARTLDATWRQRARALRSVDDAIARIHAKLRDTGHLDDTYVFVLSDNGVSLGEHRRVGKTGAYDADARMPLLISGPGLPTADRNALVGMHDLSPTILDLTGVPPLLEPDGISFRPTFSGQGIRKRLLIENASRLGSAPVYNAIRSRTRLFTDYYEIGQRELYYVDKDKDPHMLENSWQQAPSSLRTELYNRLQHLSSCRASTCHSAEGATG